MNSGTLIFIQILLDGSVMWPFPKPVPLHCEGLFLFPCGGGTWSGSLSVLWKTLKEEGKTEVILFNSLSHAVRFRDSLRSGWVNLGLNVSITVLLEDDWSSEICRQQDLWLKKKPHRQQVIISVRHNLCLCVTETRKRDAQVTALCYCCGDYQWVMCLETQGGAEYFKVGL